MNKMINKAIISGGGTGGHVFPAIAIADEIKKRNPKVDILFIGAEGKMEMEKVPAAGYRIIGLKIAGFQRKFTWSNFALPFKVLGSLWKARSIMKAFKPDVVIGVGGYASGPTLQMATMLGFPTVIQEQNSFPGKTNKILAKKVNKICVAYDHLESFFPADKIIKTGNPVRSTSVAITNKREEALAFFGLKADRKVILILGGSLGAKTLNQSVLDQLELIEQEEVQLIWQCGKWYKEAMDEAMKNAPNPAIVCLDFVARMDLAYAAADVIISRAGAMSVSELSLVAKPTILVPSPNVSEDHQTKNAMALVNAGAALLVKDVEARNTLIQTAISLLKTPENAQHLAQSLVAFGKPRATEEIVDVIESVL